MREVRALQGDTVDQLCYRHYGRTQGLTEAVLATNPGLCDHGPFLAAGQRVRLPVSRPSVNAPRLQLWE
ncbi:tail protein X [Sodalis sp.]|uniref:tail protein X n=1 Tax=Sodalis sp. (in: enterobacteria) TaxID=1898979 RepID=UPI003873B090